MTTVSAPVEVPVHQRPAVRWALAVLALIVALNLIVVVVADLLPAPSGPASSSYATTSRGLAAYAELLTRFGHPVSQLRRAPSDATLNPATTLVLLDPGGDVSDRDLAALERFVAGGGQVIAGGQDSSALATALAGDRVVWHPTGPLVAHPHYVSPSVRSVATAGNGSYDCPDREPRGQLVCASRGGMVLLLADSSPLTNTLLDRADNAALGLSLAGYDRRPIVFVENVHGFHPATGLAALPADAWWAVALLGLAGLTYLVARWRRLGPAVESDAIAVPSRREHLDALAGSLRRAGDPGPAVARLRGAAQAIVARRTGIGAEAGSAELHRAAAALGLSETDAALLIGETARDEDLVGLGRLLAHLRSEGT